MTDENPADISDPKKWALKHLQKEKNHLRGAPMAFILVLIIGFLAGWFYTWQIVVPSKNASLETLQISDSAKNSRIEGLQKENDRLVKQNTDFKTAVSEYATPLKKRAKILAGQISDFSKAHAQDANQMALQAAFGGRFEERLSKIVRQFDEAGQHSDALSQASQVGASSPAGLQAISVELVKLANNLQE